MKYNHLGNTGLKISEISLGTMIFGEEGTRGTSTEDSKKIINKFIDEGGNFIDTADVYANGRSETILGEVLKGHRDDLVIASKFRFPTGKAVNNSGLSRKYLIQAIDNSLTRLDTDYLDLYYIHGTAPHLPFKEFLSTLQQLVESGKINYIGVSNFRSWEMMKAIQIANYEGWEPFVAAQYQYSLVERNIEFEFTSLFEEEGISSIPWGPLGGGFLSGKYRPDQEQPPEGTRIATMPEGTEESWVNRATEQNWKILQEVGRISDDKGYSYPQIALRWLMERPEVDSPIIGVRTMDQLLDNLGVLEIQLTEDELDRLDKISQPHKTYPYGFIEKYCMN